MAGIIQDLSGSLERVYWVITIDALLLVLLAIYICWTELQVEDRYVDSLS
jgi:uncharacterized integral membrane protein